MSLRAALEKEDKKGFFISSQSSLSYPTGFLPLDFRNGYIIESRDINEKLLMRYNSLGVASGRFTTVIGKSGTAKTTFTVQVASNIVRNFENGLILHYDLEQSCEYTRIKMLSNFSQRELIEKYILKQERNTLEEIFEAIVMLCRIKEKDKAAYTYNSGLLDEFGRPIVSYVPTVVILDSIPTASSSEASKSDEMEGSTYASRMAKAWTQFYRKLIPFVKTFNINVLAINHINAKIDINPMAKSQSQLMYLKQDESLPGGNAAIYYAHQLFKFVSCGKYSTDTDGFDGFRVRCELIKSRTNKAGQSCILVYDQARGFDPLLTLYDFANESELIDGRNPYRYIKGFKDIKFDSRKIREVFAQNDELQKALMGSTQPLLEKYLSRIGDEIVLSEEEMMKRLAESIASEEELVELQ
jgi:RecA/RadA recombinase